MLLNNINILDRGRVALISSSNMGTRLKELANEFFRSSLHDSFPDIAHATLYLKCPLFVQLYLSKFNISIVPIPQLDKEPEAYLPDFTDVAAPDRQDSEVIADDISRTTAALLINPKAYQADGCDRFTSQLITPINVYTELVVSGSLRELIKICGNEDKPNAIKLYCNAIKDILVAEWGNVYPIDKGTL